MHISSSYAKILGQKLFRTWEFPRSGSKAKNGEKERERERLNDGDNNGQATHGARKHAWHTQAAWANRKQDSVILEHQTEKHEGGVANFHAKVVRSFRDCLTRQVSEGVSIRRCTDHVLNNKSEWHQNPACGKYKVNYTEAKCGPA